ncbi:hypothetical protein LAJLEIBI_00320 [[Clostridium] hylemonae DSM 15053]|nr:ABC transporter permease [[Clostridium] hylemonae]QEK16339.1 hypothetical protein LAJLEIBI_00320 [[Clostridium] hylemonae DSM 15053]
MKIIIKYILTNMKERKVRTAVMALTILLSSALLFVSVSIGTSYESAQKKMARGMTGAASVSVTAADSRAGLDDSTIPKLPEVKAAAGILKSSALYSEDGYYESVDLVAADLEQLNRINKPRMADGKEITGFSGNQIILPERFTSKFGIKKGDTVTLQIGKRPVSFEVYGIAAYDTLFLRQTRGATALVPLAALTAVVQPPQKYSDILLEPSEGVTAAELKSCLENILPQQQYHVSETVDEAQITADARQKSMPFFLISFFSLTMSVFIIFSSYKVITLERLPTVGTFRSIGAEEKTVTAILLAESIVYGLAGGLVGIPAGIAVLKAILHGMGKELTEGIEIPAVITLPGIVLSFAAAMTVSVLSAWIPVRRAGRLPVKDVVLGTVEEQGRPARYAVGMAVVLAAVSVILPRVAPEGLLYLAGGISLLGLITAALLIIPSLTDLAAKYLERLYGVIFHNEGILAARNMRDNKNITQNITLLFISISAVISISVVGSFVTSYISDVFQGAELEGFADGYMDEDFVEQVRKMEGVEKVLPVRVLEDKVQAEGYTFSRFEAADDLERYSSMFALRYTDSSMKQNAVSAFKQGGRALLMSEAYMKEAKLKTGDTISLSDGTFSADYRIEGSFRSRATDVEAVIPSSCAVRDFGADAYNFLAYTAADPDAVMVQIRGLFGETPNWSRTVEEFNSDAARTVGAFLEPMHSMTYFILLMAAVGIVNNLLINYMQRRRTIAMYKSAGLSNRQNVKMMLIEGFTSGSAGAVTAIFVSYLEIQTIFIVAGPKISVKPELDMVTFLAAGAMGIAITVAGTAAPIFKSCRMKLVEVIKFE